MDFGHIVKSRERWVCSGHCRLLNSYKARIASGISDVCPQCGVAPHSVEHLFKCPSNPTQLTTQDLWDDPAAVADILNLDNWRRETSGRAITTTTTETKHHFCWKYCLWSLNACCNISFENIRICCALQIGPRPSVYYVPVPYLRIKWSEFRLLSHDVEPSFGVKGQGHKAM